MQVHQGRQGLEPAGLDRRRRGGRAHRHRGLADPSGPWPRLWVNPGENPGNGIDDDGNGFIDDINGWDFGDEDNDPNDDSADPGHGTHTAGTVAGDGTGGTLTGVAPRPRN